MFIEGHRLYYVMDEHGFVLTEAAGVNNGEAVQRAIARGFTNAKRAVWHDLYRERIGLTDPIDQDVVYVKLRDAIVSDVILFP